MSDITETPIKSEPNRQPDGTFGPGNVGNPTGRPKKEFCLIDVLKGKLDDVVEITNVKTGEKKKMTIREALNDVLIKKAIGGDLAAIIAIYDRVDGKPTESIKHSYERDELTDEEVDRRIKEALDESGTTEKNNQKE